jgi:hypothetical protein
MPVVNFERLDPKLKEKINNLKRYLDPDHPTQDARYLKKGYTDAQNQARRDVLCSFNGILELEAQERDNMIPPLDRLISLISHVLTRPELLKTDERVIGAFSLLLTSSEFEQMILAQAILGLSGYPVEEIMDVHMYSKKEMLLEKQLLELAFSNREAGTSPNFKVSFESLVLKFRQVCEKEDEKQLQKCLNLLKEILTSKDSIINKNKQQKLFFKKKSKELESLEASIMIFKSILNADKQEKTESLATTEDLTDKESLTITEASTDEMSNEGGLPEIPSDEQIIQKKEEPPKKLTARDVLKNKIFKLRASTVNLTLDEYKVKKEIDKERNEIILCHQLLNKLDKLAESPVLDEPSEELNEGIEQLMGVIKATLRRPKRMAHERSLSLACFEHEALQGLIPEVLELNKPPMMKHQTLIRCINVMEKLYELSNKSSELKEPIQDMKELVRLAFVTASGMAHWHFLRENQELMKIPWKYELDHPDLSPCIEKIQDIYKISEEQLSQIKHKLCPEIFLPDRSTQIGIGRDFEVVMSGELQALFAYIDNTKNPEKIRSQVKLLATELQAALQAGSTKEKEQARDSILQTERVLKCEISVEEYQEHATHVKNYPSIRMQALGVLMFSLGAIILAVGLTSIVGAVVGGVVGGSGMAVGLNLFAKAKERQGLSKIQSDLSEKLKPLKDADHDDDDHEHGVGTNKNP